MRPLPDPLRRRCLQLSAFLCAIPLCLAPLAGRSSFELADRRSVLNERFNSPSLTATWKAQPVNVARDPFVPETTSYSQTDPAVPVVGMHVTRGQPIGFTVPLNPLVKAIVSGTSPRALIDDGSQVRVIGVGDTIGGERVLAIDRAGVRLQNGKVLALDVPRR